MNGNLAGVILSVSLICLCWILALAIKKHQVFGKYTKETARKIIHIGVSNFAFIYLYVFDSQLIPALGLVAFAFINLYIETNTGERRSWGTVYYPLTIATIISVNNLLHENTYYVAAALLAMGYGDGLAALVGMVFGKHKIPGSKNKTYIGSLTCFAVVTAVVMLITKTTFPKALLIGFVSALAEAYTPFGLDNVSVPLVIYLLEVLLCC